MKGKPILLGVLGLASLIAVGCGGDDDASSDNDSAAAPGATEAAETPAGLPDPTDACLARFEEAASVDEMQDTVEDFYPALQQCAGLDDWTSAALETNALDGTDPAVFAYTACTSGGPRSSVTCSEAIAADPYGLEALEDG